MLDSILSDDEMIIRTQEGTDSNEVEKSIYKVKKDLDEQRLVEEVARRLHLQHSMLSYECQNSPFFNSSIEALVTNTLSIYSDVTGVKIG